MENQQIQQLHNLSWDEKFEIIQFLWNDIIEHPENLSFPDEHKKILLKRIESIENGTAEFTPWSDVKKKYFTE